MVRFGILCLGHIKGNPFSDTLSAEDFVLRAVA